MTHLHVLKNGRTESVIVLCDCIVQMGDCRPRFSRTLRLLTLKTDATWLTSTLLYYWISKPKETEVRSLNTFYIMNRTFNQCRYDQLWFRIYFYACNRYMLSEILLRYFIISSNQRSTVHSQRSLTTSTLVISTKLLPNYLVAPTDRDAAPQFL